MCGATKALRGLFILLFGLCLTAVLGAPAQAATGINQQLSFQGKVVNSNGTNIADGTYNMEFKIYQDGTNTGSGSTLKWTEDRLIGGTGGVTVTSGTFQVNLGSANAFGSSVDWNQDTLWLSFQVGNTSSCTITTNFQSNCSGDGEMSPYIRLTAVPYAMNANRVGGLTASQLVQLNPSSTQSGAIDINGNIKTAGGSVLTNTLDAAAGGGLTIASGTTVLTVAAASTTFASSVTVQGGNINVGTNSNAASLVLHDGTLADHTITFNTPNTILNSPVITWFNSGATGSQCLQSTSESNSMATTLQWGSCGGTVTLQQAYAAGNAITTPTSGSASDLAVTLSDSSGTDSNYTVNIANGSTSKFAVQYNSVDALKVDSSGVTITTAPKITALATCNNIYTDSTGTMTCGTNLVNSVSSLQVAGHSIAYGVGASDMSHRYTSVVAGMLHATENNLAVGGAVASYDETGAHAGGWAKVMQNVVPTRSAAPYLPMPGVGVINYGINDIGYTGPSFTTPYINAMRAIIARFRAAAVFEESSGTFTFSQGTGAANWGAAVVNTSNSGSGAELSTSNGNTYTIAVPSDFPGGTIDIGLVANPGKGAVHTYTVDGSPAGSIDTRNVAPNGGGADSRNTGMVMRLTGLSAGAHTVVGTIGSLNTQTFVDYWSIEAPQPRPVLVVSAARANNYNGLYGGALYVPTDADVNSMNSSLQSLISEFDSSVKYVDVDSALNKNSAYFSPDTIHPNDAGMTVMAQTVYNTLNTWNLTTSQLLYSAAPNGISSQSSVLYRNSWDSTAMFQIQNAAGSKIFNVDTTNSKIGVGLQPVSSGATMQIQSSGTALRFGAGASDDGGYLVSAAANIALLSGGSNFNGTNWVARSGTSVISGSAGAYYAIYTDGALTTGNTFTPTLRYSLLSSGDAAYYLANSATAFQLRNAANNAAYMVVDTSGSGALSLAGVQPAAVSDNGVSAATVLTVTGTKGGNTTGTSATTGGAGGGISLTTGNGGNAAGSSVNGSGGSITLVAGAAGTGGTGGTAGGVLIKNAGNSTTAFQVQPAASATPVLAVNTSNNIVGVNLQPSTTGSALQVAGALQAKQSSAAAWASGLEGSFVYDDTANKFYLYDNSALKEVCNKVDLGCAAAPTTTLQSAYDATTGNTIVTPATGSARDISFTLSDSTGTDSNFLVNITSGSAGKFAVQNGGSDILSVDTSSGINVNTDINSTGSIYLNSGGLIDLYEGNIILEGLDTDGLTLGPGGFGNPQISMGGITLASSTLSPGLQIGGSAKITADSTTAFKVQSTGGTALLTADTDSQVFTVGTAYSLQVNFSAATNFATATNPSSVATGDFNGDGKQDTVITNDSGPNISVFLNSTATNASTPTFNARADFTTLTRPYAVVVADINGDGKPDIAIAQNNSITNAKIGIFLNTTATNASTPTFSTRTDFAVDANPQAITAADINGDGKPDLATANNANGTMSVILNTTATNASTPSFATKVNFTTGTFSQGISNADFNGDGKPDLVVSNYGPNTASVFLNTTATNASTPSFATKVDFTTGTSPYFVATSDVNGDGKIDMATTNHDGTSVSVFLNTTATNASTPSFTTKTDFTTGSTPEGIVFSDINEDGKKDLLIANYGTTTVSLLLNNTATNASTPSFSTKQDYTVGTNAQGVTAADFNGDNHADFATANYNSDNMSVLLNQYGASSGIFSVNGTTHVVQVGSITNNVQFDGSTYEMIFSGTAQHSRTVVLTPEYPGATMTGDGSNNTGTMTSDFCSGSSRMSINTTICAATETYNYYSWTSASGTNDYDIYVRYTVPSDYAGSPSFAMAGWRTSSSDSVTTTIVADNLASGSICGQSSVASGTAVWSTNIISNTCSLAANDTITIRIHMSAVATEYTRAGKITFGYKSKW